MDLNLRKMTALLLGLSLFPGCTGIVGCAGSGDNGSVTLQDTVTTLKEARFKGNFHFNHNGRPFSLGNESYAGANVAIVAEGEVDFSEAAE
jgi:hypothetical protein